jgi:hypothetical protein
MGKKYLIEIIHCLDATYDTQSQTTGYKIKKNNIVTKFG